MRRRRFHPAMLRLLERKRAEKLAQANMRRHAGAAERNLSGPRSHDPDGTPSGKPFLFADTSLDIPLLPERASLLTLPEVLAVRSPGLYAALQAEKERVAARTKAKVRRRKASAADAKRLKQAVERVRKGGGTNPPAEASTPTDELPADVWHGPKVRARCDHPGHDPRQ